ncbi:MAG: hypothetical protein WCP69_10025 [Bacteroidota bacterium]
MKIQYIIAKFLLFIVIIFCFESSVLAQLKKGSLKNSGADYGSKSTNKKGRKGGRNTLPVGLEGKKINIGLAEGLAIPGLSMQTEEHSTIGSNTSFYAHYVFNGSSTFGIGFNSNIITLGVSSSKFYDNNLNLTLASVSPWQFYTFSPSFLTNFSLTKRASAQFIINSGLLFAKVPLSHLIFTDSIKTLGEPTVVQSRDYLYNTTLEMGWFVSGGFQFNYALTHNIEARIGVDYLYGRFSYDRIQMNSESLTKSRLLRELKLIDVFTGIAVSF